MVVLVIIDKIWKQLKCTQNKQSMKQSWKEYDLSIGINHIFYFLYFWCFDSWAAATPGESPFQG